MAGSQNKATMMQWSDWIMNRLCKLNDEGRCWLVQLLFIRWRRGRKG